MKYKSITLLILTLLGIGMNFEAWAVIGAPLTPMSYAGVARRTTRRAVVATSVATDAATGSVAVSTLPAGCARTMVGSVTYHNCSGTYYQPSYSGPNVVYVPVPAPTG